MTAHIRPLHGRSAHDVCVPAFRSMGVTPMLLSLCIALLTFFLPAPGAFAAATDTPPAPAGAMPTPTADLHDVINAAINAVTPALVRIHAVTVSYRDGREVKDEVYGSGVIISREGYVVTNHHVAGHATYAACTLEDQEEIDATLVGTDVMTDIAVLKLKPSTPRVFPFALFGNSDDLRVGDQVFAMGSPLAFSQSVTMGIVSNTQLVLSDVMAPMDLEGEDVGATVRWIGHDAQIWHGNSGGPLVNTSGKVVGINEISVGLGGAKIRKPCPGYRHPPYPRRAHLALLGRRHAATAVAFAGGGRWTGSVDLGYGARVTRRTGGHADRGYPHKGRDQSINGQFQGRVTPHQSVAHVVCPRRRAH